MLPEAHYQGRNPSVFKCQKLFKERQRHVGHVASSGRPKCINSIKILKNAESCLFGQGQMANQAYHLRNKYGQGSVKLCVEGGLNFAQTSGYTPMTKLQLIVCSLSCSSWQQRIY